MSTKEQQAAAAVEAAAAAAGVALQFRDVPFHAKTAKECFHELDCSENLLQEGLTTAEASKRLEKFGYNKLTEKTKVTLLQRIWKQIANVLVAILVIVAIVSLVRAVTTTVSEEIVTDWIQFGLIVFVVM